MGEATVRVGKGTERMESGSGQLRSPGDGEAADLTLCSGKIKKRWEA